MLLRFVVAFWMLQYRTTVYPYHHVEYFEIRREGALCLLPVQCIEGFFTALNITLKRLLLGVNTNVDFEAIGGQEGLPTSLLVAYKGIFPPVSLLMGAQVACSAVGTRAALKGALIALHL